MMDELWELWYSGHTMLPLPARLRIMRAIAELERELELEQTA